MKKRTIDRRVKGILPLLSLLFWIGLWFVLSSIVDNSYFLPSPIDTVASLIDLLSESYFYKVIFLSLLRVIAGLALGTLLGVLLATLCYLFPWLKSFVTPIVTLIKAMPVAAFIIILWITVRGSALTILIGVMMVMPIIFQNTLEGYGAINTELRECALVFELPTLTRLKLLVLPTVLSYLAPALITSIGLAFKSQIAAEIIAYTKSSIGQYIFDAKYNLNTPEVFAWALVIISFSILIERLTRLIMRRVRNVSEN